MHIPLVSFPHLAFVSHSTTQSLALLLFRHLRQRAVHPIRLDRRPSRVLGLLVNLSEHKLQVLAVAFAVADGEDTAGELEDIKLHDSGAGVFREDGRGGVHGQGCHFADGIPACGRDA